MFKIWWRSEVHIKSYRPFSAVLSVPSKHHSAVFHTESCLGDHIKNIHTGQDINQQIQREKTFHKLWQVTTLDLHHYQQTLKPIKTFTRIMKITVQTVEKREESEDEFKPFPCDKYDYKVSNEAGLTRKMSKNQKWCAKSVSTKLSISMTWWDT